VKAGDLVRIRLRTHLSGHGPAKPYDWWLPGGIVVEYNSWEKIVTVLYEGDVKRIRANDVQLVSKGK
jgi:hypothetical protein